MYRVFRVPAAQSAKIDTVLHDDLVSRQSVVVRDARSLGVDGEGTIVLVEGSGEALARADVLLEGARMPAAEAEAAYKKFRSQDEDAASGMGLIFGL